MKSAIVFFLLAAPLRAADWPVFRGNPAMTGVADIALPDQLEERWTFKTGNAIEGAPAVVAGVVYVASTDKHLYALDLKTGAEKWKQKLGAPMKASPAVKGDRVYIGDSEGKLYCCNTATGAVVWTFETAGEITAGVNFHKDRILVGSHDSTLYAITADGKKEWEYKIDGPVNGSPAVVGDRTFVAGCDSMLHVVDANTGKAVGTVDIGGQAGATAAVFGDGVYVGTMSNQVIAVDWKTIKRSWMFEAPRRQQPFYGSAAVTESHVYVGSRDKRVYALDRAGGQEKWSFATDGMVDASPLVVGPRLYIGSQSGDGSFYVLDAKTGTKLQELSLMSPVTGSAAAGPDCILVGTEKGMLHCLGKK